MSRMCKWLKEEDLPDHVLEDDSARNCFVESITWRSTDFLGHLVGDTEGRGSITFTCV